MVDREVLGGKMKVLAGTPELREIILAAKRGGLKVGLVPTMGALHEGHASLIRAAKINCDFLVVSIFVNPKQFGPAEDYNAYPRDLKKDLDLILPHGVDVVFTPEPAVMFPSGFSSNVEVDGGISEALCGKSRPGHFAGVATVVAKLFNLAQPDIAFFGAKDYQQQLIIKKMTVDLNFPVEIVTLPTIREQDGLAMSSRNAYLRPEERRAAGVIFKALQLAREEFKEKSPWEMKRRLKVFIENEPLAKIDYLELVDPETLTEATDGHKKVLVAAAVFVGKTRLIDNMVIEKK